MDIKKQILSSAERVFDHDGFNATGMGRLVRESGLSSRTVYKHVTSKNALMALVLAERQQRFFDVIDFSSLESLFDSLKAWFARDGMRGCLFFRIQAETGGNIPEISAAVAAYHDELHRCMSGLVRRETGTVDEDRVEQLLVVFEGATTASTYRGEAALNAAKFMARQLLGTGVER